MAHTRKNELRLLTADEMTFVEKARHPLLGEMSDSELTSLLHYLQDKRERALTIANNQRRALRGKGGRGAATFEQADSGNRQKASVLNDAVLRARREVRRREEEAEREALKEGAKAELMANAQRALELKRAAGGPQRPSGGPTAKSGMVSKAKTKVSPIGASGEAGRVTKFVAVAQAKKDSR